MRYDKGRRLKVGDEVILDIDFRDGIAVGPHKIIDTKETCDIRTSGQLVKIDGSKDWYDIGWFRK